MPVSATRRLPVRPDRSIEQLLVEVRRPAAALLSSHGIADDDAEDLLQEVLTAMVFKWDSIHNPVAWFLATLEKRCESHRRRVLDRLMETEEAERLLREATAASPQQLAELRHDLNAAVSRLPADYRRLLRLRYGLGCTGAEVAEQLGCGHDGVRRNLTACLTMLADDLAAGGFLT